MAKYIQPKQMIIYSITLFVLVFYSILKVADPLYLCILSFFIVLSGICFVPSIKRELEYSDIIQTFVFYLSMYIWIFDIIFHYKNYQIKTGITIRLFGIGLVCLLLFLRRTDIKRILDGPIGRMSIIKHEFTKELVASSIAILSEEIYFTAFVICKLRHFGPFTPVFISAVLFALSHYLNRWSKTMFKIKDYIYIFFFGIVKGIVFYYSNDIFLTILMHFIYNSSDFYILVRRMKLTKKNNETVMFDDY